jgi:LmbE family N-acetylglucosaminyl deacetylase
MPSSDTALTDYQRYLLVDAHPDDEVHCAVLLARLLTAGKAVHIVVLTNGDAGQNPAHRLAEMTASIEAIGLQSDNLTLVGISERDLLQDMPTAYDKTLAVAENFHPDCLISIDFDGGHEGHDTAAFIADLIAHKLETAHWVFPDYNWQHGRRFGLHFLPGRSADEELSITPQEKDLKIKVLEAHSGQLGFYLRLQKVQDDYFKLLFDRELYRRFRPGHDFVTRPDYPIGYEFHRNGFSHEDFATMARSLMTRLDDNVPAHWHLHRQLPVGLTAQHTLQHHGANP